MDQFLTVSEVAEILKVKEMTVREMFRSGRLRGFKIGKSWRTTHTMLQADLDGMWRSQMTPADVTKEDRQDSEGDTPIKRRRGRPRKDERLENTHPPEKVPAPPQEKVKEPVDDSQTYLF